MQKLLVIQWLQVQWLEQWQKPCVQFLTDAGISLSFVFAT